MRRLDDIERLARFVAPGDIHPQFKDDDEVVVARALLAMLPVVRAALAWADPESDQDDTRECNALMDAVDQMRRTLEQKP